jgi:hypothetical protein
VIFFVLLLAVLTMCQLIDCDFLLLTLFSPEAYQAGTIPTLEEMKKLRQHEKGWEFICEELLPAVVGVTTWETRSVIEEIRNFATVSDVAFCLLTVENNWDYWASVADPNLQEQDQQSIYKDTKWTSSTLIAGRNTGWSQDGLQTFNELCKMENDDRNTNPMVEKEYLLKKKAKQMMAQKKPGRVARIELGVQAYVDENSLDF